MAPNLARGVARWVTADCPLLDLVRWRLALTICPRQAKVGLGIINFNFIQLLADVCSLLPNRFKMLS